jgi:secreted PhoX family phosphatase
MLGDYMKTMDRRDFLRFMGVTAIGISGASTLIACKEDYTLKPMQPDFTDDLSLADGLSYEVLISWQDPINAKDKFGFNNDYIDYVKLNDEEIIMWVNHEYLHPLFIAGNDRNKKAVDIERKEVGGSIIHYKKQGKKWSLVSDSEYNRRIDGSTKIPFHLHEIEGSSFGEGTLGNCAGGNTPWGTILTCEENYHMFYGERKDDGSVTESLYAWEKYYNNPPEHYGWVVEVDLKTGNAKKHVNLGRFAHECATTIISKSGHVVAYTGDDKNDEHLYKFVSETSDSFDKGILYVANIEKGQWLPLDLEKSPQLKKHFKSQTEVLTYVRKASKILGATPLARPEDIEIHPKTKDVYVTLTNNKKRDNFHGSIMKISENGGDHSALKFKSETFAFGGEPGGFSCPDNLAFDKNGNLWMTNDISGSAIGKDPYTPYGNNGLFVFPASGPLKGSPIQLASAPVNAELTGLKFSPDQKQLFLSVQHPGEKTKDLAKPTSNWPNKNEKPRPSVVVLSGPVIENLTR